MTEDEIAVLAKLAEIDFDIRASVPQIAEADKPGEGLAALLAALRSVLGDPLRVPRQLKRG